MIFVPRVNEPLILKINKVNWLKEYLAAIKINKSTPTKMNKEIVGKKENKYRQPEVKAALKNMFSDKCAYCESYIGHISYGHIEHFKPKVKYPKYCFEWNNFLLGCEICNGSLYKGENYPQKKENGPLINPTKENPYTFFSFEYDPNTATANVLGKNARGITSEKLFGLNRPGLVKHRSRVVKRMVYIAIMASKGDADALKEIRGCINADEEYSAFAITLFKKYKLK